MADKKHGNRNLWMVVELLFWRRLQSSAGYFGDDRLMKKEDYQAFTFLGKPKTMKSRHKIKKQHYVRFKRDYRIGQ